MEKDRSPFDTALLWYAVSSSLLLAVGCAATLAMSKFTSFRKMKVIVTIAGFSCYGAAVLFADFVRFVESRIGRININNAAALSLGVGYLIELFIIHPFVGMLSKFVKKASEDKPLIATTMAHRLIVHQATDLQDNTNRRDIIWPPAIIVLNNFDQGRDNKQGGNQELLSYFDQYAAVDARQARGLSGNIGVLLFECSLLGYMEANRLNEYFINQGTDRDAWLLGKSRFLPNGIRQIFGFLASKEDMEAFNKNCQGESHLKYEIKTYDDMVILLKDMHNELNYLKNKLNQTEQHSEAVEQEEVKAGEEIELEVIRGNTSAEQVEIMKTTPQANLSFHRKDLPESSNTGPGAIRMRPVYLDNNLLARITTSSSAPTTKGWELAVMRPSAAVILLRALPFVLEQRAKYLKAQKMKPTLIIDSTGVIYPENTTAVVDAETMTGQGELEQDQAIKNTECTQAMTRQDDLEQAKVVNADNADTIMHNPVVMTEENIDNEKANHEETMEQNEDLSVAIIPSNKRKGMALPNLISTSDSRTPLIKSSVRRSNRLSSGKEGFCSVRIDKEPSKRAKNWAVEVDEKTGEIRPLSISTLQGWGISCGVDPSDLTEDALLQAPLTYVQDEEHDV